MLHLALIAVVLTSAARKSAAIGLAVSAATLAGAATAHAATLSLSGVPPSSLQSNFDPTGWAKDAAHDFIGAGSTVYVFDSNSTGGLKVDTSAKVTFTYMGTEAAYQNLSFTANFQTPLFDNKTTGLGAQSGPYAISAGYVPFAFESIGAGNKWSYNGGSISPNLLLAFAVVSPTRAYAFLEDIAVGGDRDLDDMVVRIDVTSTPLPAALPLFASGAAALGLFDWRRRRRDPAAA